MRKNTSILVRENHQQINAKKHHYVPNVKINILRKNEKGKCKKRKVKQ